VRLKLGRCCDDSAQAGIQYLRRKKSCGGPPSADAFPAQDHTWERKEEDGKKGKEREGLVVLNRAVAVQSVVGSRRAPPPTCAGGGIRVLHIDNANGAWCRLAPSSERHGC